MKTVCDNNGRAVVVHQWQYDCVSQILESYRLGLLKVKVSSQNPKPHPMIYKIKLVRACIPMGLFETKICIEHIERLIEEERQDWNNL